MLLTMKELSQAAPPLEGEVLRGDACESSFDSVPASRSRSSGVESGNGHKKDENDPIGSQQDLDTPGHRGPPPPPRDWVDHRPDGGPLLRYLWCSLSDDDEGVVVESDAATDPDLCGVGGLGGEYNNDDSTEGDGSKPRPRTRTPPSSGRQALSGQTLYLGGEVGCDGNMYCIPGHAARVLTVRVADGTDTVALIGPEFPGKFKWLRGVSMGDVIYGLPCHADSVLRIHVPTQTVTTLAIPYENFYGSDMELARQQRRQEWKYHGGSVSPHNGCLYGIPQSALHVLKIDPVADAVTLVGPPLPGRYKWYGGVVGRNDGAIYGIPHNASSVLRIGRSDRITLHGSYGEGGHKWHGAAAAATAEAGNGAIVSVPANADTVLCIYPNIPTDMDDDPAPTLVELGGPDCVQTGRHRTDRKYKYLGAMAGPDGTVYCFPSGSEHVLRVDPDARTVRQLGPNLSDAKMERLCQNKWQNGVCVNHPNEKAVYAIPLAAESVLRIDCSKGGREPEITTWHLPEPFRGLAKWEGAVLAPNGVIYTVPNNHKAILRIESPPSTSTLNITTESNTTFEPKLHPAATTGPRRDDVPYASGIPTLRSSVHRVKHPSKKEDLGGHLGGPRPKDRDGKETGITFLPNELCQETVLEYDLEEHDLANAVRNMLEQCDPNVVGSFDKDDTFADAAEPPRLESFRVQSASTWRTANGGQCEAAQRYLSDQVARNDAFLAVFDRFVHGVVLPHVKRRLVDLGLASDAPGSVKFFYQRPPTLRLQPGPARARVKPHSDAEYGHQNGELVRQLAYVLVVMQMLMYSHHRHSMCLVLYAERMDPTHGPRTDGRRSVGRIHSHARRLPSHRGPAGTAGAVPRVLLPALRARQCLAAHPCELGLSGWRRGLLRSRVGDARHHGRPLPARSDAVVKYTVMSMAYAIRLRTILGAPIILLLLNAI
jgi:hypothetical protein